MNPMGTMITLMSVVSHRTHTGDFHRILDIGVTSPKQDEIMSLYVSPNDHNASVDAL
jgi:hypothetical protein